MLGLIARIEIAAAIEDVWDAISTADGITRWFAPTAEVVPGVGGHVFVSWGGEMQWTTPITVWDPPHHLQLLDERDKPRSDSGVIKADAPSTPVRVTIDYLLEGHGSTTVLRIVHAGFGASADWDDEFESTRHGWAQMTQNLRHAVEGHPGK